MTTMICPNVEKCREPFKIKILGKYDSSRFLLDHQRCLPHNNHTYCKRMNSKTCPSCIPYKFKVGDRVRILGKEGRRIEPKEVWSDTPWKLGDIGFVSIAYENGLMFLSTTINGNSKNGYFISKDLEWLPPISELSYLDSEDNNLTYSDISKTYDECSSITKYKPTDKNLSLIELAKVATEEEIGSFLKNYIKSPYASSPELILKIIATEGDYNIIVTESLIEYITKKSTRTVCFTRWAIKEGIIEEIKVCPTCGKEDK